MGHHGAIAVGHRPGVRGLSVDRGRRDHRADAARGRYAQRGDEPARAARDPDGRERGVRAQLRFERADAEHERDRRVRHGRSPPALIRERPGAAPAAPAGLAGPREIARSNVARRASLSSLRAPPAVRALRERGRPHRPAHATLSRLRRVGVRRCRRNRRRSGRATGGRADRSSASRHSSSCSHLQCEYPSSCRAARPRCCSRSRSSRAWSRERLSASRWRSARRQ